MEHNEYSRERGEGGGGSFLVAYLAYTIMYEGFFPGGSVVKNPPANSGDAGSVPGLGKSPGEGNGNPLQYSCLENPMNRGAWWATVHWSQRVGHDFMIKQQQQRNV